MRESTRERKMHMQKLKFRMLLDPLPCGKLEAMKIGLPLKFIKMFVRIRFCVLLLFNSFYCHYHTTIFLFCPISLMLMLFLFFSVCFSDNLELCKKKILDDNLKVRNENLNIVYFHLFVLFYICVLPHKHHDHSRCCCCFAFVNVFFFECVSVHIHISSRLVSFQFNSFHSIFIDNA